MRNFYNTRVLDEIENFTLAPDITEVPSNLIHIASERYTDGYYLPKVNSHF